MKLRLVVAMTFCLMLAAVPAVAGGVYDNGPINGTVEGWTINLGFVISDSWTITGNPALVTGFSFGAWLFPGDTLTSAEVSFTSQELGGTTYFDGVVNFSQGSCFANQYGYNVCAETGSFSQIALNPGTYWVNLQNAIVPSGDPVYWDENSGPSQASNDSIGTLPSEAFTILGMQETTGTTTTTGTTPEPASILLFGSGVLGVTNLLRRKRL